MFLSRIYIILLVTCIFSAESYSQVIVTPLQNLTFGEVFIGYSAQVQHTESNAAKFTVSPSSGRRDIMVTFNLPSTLQYSTYSVPITFSFAQSAWSMYDLATGRTNFNPFTPVTWTRIHSTETIYIWLGGSVTLTAGIPPGTYQGTIIITAEIF